ncbi:MAG: DUF4974 domain-containing protein [Prevotella sp.]|nr:DUF4974 domain-containing protein [Prevotella sp.]
MEKLRKLTQMTEHPELYSDEEWQEIFDGETVSDEQVEAEWERFEQQHFSQHNRQWLKIAASFIGVLILSGVALAAIHLASSHHDDDNSTMPATTISTQGVGEAQPEMGERPHTVVFENAELQQIVDSLTYYYNIKPVYRYDAPRHLRLYYEWDQRNSIEDIASQISQFDRVSISLMGDSIIIE